MGTIKSGVGLISGLNISSLVDQLVAIDSRPRDLLSRQASSMDSIKAVWLDLSARLLSLKASAVSFTKMSSFNAVTAVSSSSSLVVSAAAGAAVGAYRITPARLATTHQLVSAGVADPDSTPIGGGEITIDIGRGHLNPASALAMLNGGAGVARGSIRITDRSGGSAVVDLKLAGDLQDVLDAINNTAGVAVRAAVSGDRIVLADVSGSSAGNLIVAEVEGGSTAASLGILGSVSADTLTGDDIVYVNSGTVLAHLNDGNGIRTGLGNDIRFTLKDGSQLLVNLSSARKLGDVIDAINSAGGNDGKLVADIAPSGDALRLTDTTDGQAGALTIEAIGDSRAALDLGLLGSAQDGTIVGQRLLAGLNTVLLRNLNGQAGVIGGTISIQDRGTGSAVIDLSSAQSLQDVIDAINDAEGVSVRASLNVAGTGIEIVDASGQSQRNFVIADVDGTLASELNIVHDGAQTTVSSGRLSHRYVSENSRLDELGIIRGKFRITDSAGASAVVDLTQGNEITLGHVITELNTRGLGVVASINSAGNGLLLTDTAGGPGALTVVESGSTTAASLGILGRDDDANGFIDGARQVKVVVGPNDTLAKVALAINQAAAGRLSAMVINDGSSVSPYRLILTSQTSGQNGRIVLDPGSAGLSFATMSRPQDALLFFGDPSQDSAVAIRSSTNTIDGAIEKATIHIAGTSSVPVDISISGTIDGLVNSLSSFASNFNSTVDRINLLTSFDINAGTRGVLQGDAVANRLRSQLFTMITGAVEGTTGQYDRLTQIGFSVTANGTQISFDESKFRAAWAADPDGVQSLFTLAEAGIGGRIESVLGGFTDNLTGTIRRQVDGVDGRRQTLNARISQLDAMLDRKRERLLRQFTAMERALSQMQAQSSSLNNLSMALASMITYSTPSR